MAEKESEDSSDGTLVIDEPNYDSETIEILGDSDSDVEIVELNHNKEDNSDVEIVELDDNINDDSDVEIVELDDNVNDDSDVEIVELDNHRENASTSLYPSSSSTNTNLTCKSCSKVFSTNNDLLNHIRKFKGRIGGCSIITNNTFSKRKIVESPKSDHLIKKQYGRPSKNNNVIDPQIPLSVLKPAPKTIPLRRPSVPELIPIIFKAPNKPTIANNNNILPPLSKILVDEIEPEYPCTICGKIFHHNIGLLCHLSTEHNNENETTNNKESKKERKSKKNLAYENMQIQNEDPISDTVDLTLIPDFKKESLLNKMKSYVYSTSKGQVICLLCNVDFKNTKRALTHVEDKHITDKRECGYCNMKFVYELKLRSHMAKRHNVISVYTCDKCSKMINNDEKASHSKVCKEKVNPMIIKRENISNSL